MSKHKSFIGVKNASDSTLELHFTDMIYDGFNWETWEAENMVQNTIDKIKDANPTKIHVVINSLGGDVMIGLALYNYIKNHPAEVSVEIVGFAASIASIMAMAADKGQLKMAKNSFMIIHAAWSVAFGNAKEMREQAETLDKITNELADIYAQRTGKKASHFTDMWAGGDVWLTGTEALEMGLVDELFNAEVKAHASLKDFDFKNIPAELLNEAKGEPDAKTFFSNLKTDFMKILDSFKAAITGAKAEATVVPEKDAVLALVESVLTPVITQMEAELEALKPKEEDKPADPPAKTADQVKLEEMETEMALLKKQIANSNAKQEDDGAGKKVKASKLVAEYEPA